MKDTVVIFGASSFLGSNLAQAFSSQYRVVGTYYSTPVTMDNVLTIPCDIVDKNRIQQILYTFKPKYTFYCIGLSSITDCANYPKVADALNTAGVFNVAMYTERYGSKLIYISNPYMFAGEDISYNESDTPMPSCVYGNTVAATEFFIQKSCLNYLVLRTCKLYGRSINVNDLNFFEVMEYHSALNKKLNCDGHVHTGFMDVSLFSVILRNCLESGVSNRLLHVSTQDVNTHYQFAKSYAKIFGQNEAGFVRSDWDFPLQANIFNSNAINEKLFFKMDTMNLQRSIGLTMPTIEESLEFTKSRFSSTVKTSAKVKTNVGIKYI